MKELPTRYIYCLINKENDFEVFEDRDGHIVIITKLDGTQVFSKRSKALKYINSQIKSGKKLATDYTLRVLTEDLAELGESKGLK
jgi:hypothetical protein